MDILNFIGVFIFLSGFIIGLGAVTVIDIHGFLGRKSPYWTEATTRTHKVTKPLIWIGMLLAIIGGIIFYRNESFTGVPLMHAIIAAVLIVNGTFLSFRVSPFLLEQEKAGKSSTLLPDTLQRKIVVSMLISDLGWWGGLGLLVFQLVNQN